MANSDVPTSAQLPKPASLPRDIAEVAKLFPQLASRDREKIADYGMAKRLGKSPADLTLTQSNHVMGTPHYMAHEQMARPLEVDHRGDIYSLGVVFYEMLTGELPIGRFVSPPQK